MTSQIDAQAADFDRTMQGLSQGLHVRSIMSSPLQTIAPDGSPADFFETHREKGFDCAPVSENGRIVGMVYAEDCGRTETGQTAQQLMRPLSRVPVVSGDLSLGTLMDSMRATREHFWLVLNGTAIDAIVTRSDLWKTPVRLLLIARILHLEQLMTRLIATCDPGETWLDAFTDDRRRKVIGIQSSLRDHNEHVDTLECTNFSDKITIIRKALGRTDISEHLGSIDSLRNQLMHARDGSDDAGGIDQLLDRAATLVQVITQLRAELKEPT